MRIVCIASMYRSAVVHAVAKITFFANDRNPSKLHLYVYIDYACCIVESFSFTLSYVLFCSVPANVSNLALCCYCV